MKGDNKKYILIDATYINSGGGKVLLDILVKTLSKYNNYIYYFFDSRNNIKTINKGYNLITCCSSKSKFKITI